MRIAVAITGASGTIYALRLLDRLAGSERVERIYVVASRNGEAVGRYEIGGDFPERLETLPKVTIFGNDDMFAPIASGSAACDAMVIVPCSMGTAGRIASGTSDNLIARVADVMLKERRKLIVVPRETPLSLIHIENLGHLTRAGAVVMPASPSFYSLPATIEELADTVVERITDQLGLDTGEKYRWGQGK